MPLYESVYISRPDISAAQVESLTESLTAIIGENGGRVTKNEYWGLKNLAYKIKKNRKAHYTLLNIDAPAAAVHELERNMRINEDVLRYLTIRVDELDENPSVMMQTRSSRDDRGRNGRGGGYRGGDGPGRDRSGGPSRESSGGGDKKPSEPEASAPAKAEAASGGEKAEAASGGEKAETASGGDEK